jgi:carboxymethylenebutenolidase
MTRKTSADFPEEVLEIFDDYVHGKIDRRGFLDRAARFATGGMTAAAFLAGLAPDYSLAAQVAESDARIGTTWVDVPSPRGHGTVRGYLAAPQVDPKQELPGVVVVHENRGLNPYVADVARRLATEGFLALAPDGLTSLGGYPGTDDEGRAMQKTLDKAKLLEDFRAAFRLLRGHARCTGKVGIVGFCFGGWVSNMVAVHEPDLAAAVPFYGRQPSAEEAARIRAPLLLHFAENDPRVNAGWPAYEAALEAQGKRYTAHTYPGVNHGFHNDTTPRFDEAAAKLAWARTLEFFREELE